MLGLTRVTTERRTFDEPPLPRPSEVGFTSSGVSVTPESALSVPSVWACLQLTAGVISTMPLDEFLERDGVNVNVDPSPLVASPSAFVAAENWHFQGIESMIMHGNAFGVVVSRDRLARPTQIELVHPSTLRVQKNQKTQMWDVWVDGKSIDRDDIWHVPGRPKLGSPWGIGLMEYMQETVGVGVAARRYGAQYFGDGAHPSMIVKPPTDPGEDGAKRLKQKLVEILRGNREPLVVPPGTDVAEWQSSPAEAALVDVLRQNSTDVAQFFVVPPELVGGATGDSMTYSNVESRVLNLLAFGVAFWMTKWERAITRTLSRPQHVKFNEAAIIRTDEKTKIETLATSIRSSLRTPNEGRDKLDLPPVANGDAIVWPPFTTSTDGASSSQPAARARDHVVVSPQVNVNVEERSASWPPPQPASVSVPIELHTPEPRVDAFVNVVVPEQLPPNITVRAEPSPVVVHVDSRRTVRTVERDEDGRIVRVIDEEPAP